MFVQGRALQFDQWRIVHLAEFGIVNFSEVSPSSFSKKSQSSDSSPKAAKRRKSGQEAEECPEVKQDLGQTQNTESVSDKQNESDAVIGENITEPETETAKERKFVCSTCGEDFANMMSLNLHKNSCVPDDFYDEFPSDIIEHGDLPYRKGNISTPAAENVRVSSTNISSVTIDEDVNNPPSSPPLNLPSNPSSDPPSDTPPDPSYSPISSPPSSPTSDTPSDPPSSPTSDTPSDPPASPTDEAPSPDGSTKSTCSQGLSPPNKCKEKDNPHHETQHSSDIVNGRDERQETVENGERETNVSCEDELLLQEEEEEEVVVVVEGNVNNEDAKSGLELHSCPEEIDRSAAEGPVKTDSTQKYSEHCSAQTEEGNKAKKSFPEKRSSKLLKKIEEKPETNPANGAKNDKMPKRSAFKKGKLISRLRPCCVFTIL